MDSGLDADDPAFIPLPESAIASVNNSPPESMRLPNIPVQAPPGVAPLPRFRSERLLPAPNMTSPIPPTWSGLRFTPQCPAIQRLDKAFTGPDRRRNPRYIRDRFIPHFTNTDSFRVGATLDRMSRDERVLRCSDRFRGDRSRSPGRNPSETNYPQQQRQYQDGIIAAGRAINHGAGSSRGTEVNINILGNQESPEVERKRHETRIASALDIDRCERVLNFFNPKVRSGFTAPIDSWQLSIENLPWIRQDVLEQPVRDKSATPITNSPFRVLDAPGLRDDYYCSLIAYSPITHCLAVGLNSDVYTWTETGGAVPFPPYSSVHVTSLAYSSTVGGRNILAIGRIDGSLCFWGMDEEEPRIERPHAAGIACISWRPVVQKRWRTSYSEVSVPDQEVLRSMQDAWVNCEDVLVGDEMGAVFYYTVAWDVNLLPGRDGGDGAVIRLIKKIVPHTQQICGLCWSSDGLQFATGGNDNVACLFNVNELFSTVPPEETMENRFRREKGRYRWAHGAAVKAMSFCPWQKSLLATGGGSNDRCIHFFHTYSGACLATVNVSAQVTSLLWSPNRREIAATFGYANPEHKIRIAVFSWPECKQTAAIEWNDDLRALYGLHYSHVFDEDGLPGAGRNDVEEAGEEEWAALEQRIRSRTQRTPSALYRTVQSLSRGSSLARSDAEPALPPNDLNTSSRPNTLRGRGSVWSRRPLPSPQPTGQSVDSAASAGQAAIERRNARARQMRWRPNLHGHDGCIVVAASDETVRFHQVWSNQRRGIHKWRGVLGGSDILEGLEGIEKEGGMMDMIR